MECEIADCGLRIADCESGEIARIRNWEPRRNKNMVTSVPSTIRDPQSEIRNCQSAIGNPKIAYLSAMKKLLFILIVSVIYSACTNRTAGIHEMAKTDSVSFPYTAGYSSKFSIGSDSNSLAVLANYKAWEAGDMDAFRNTLGDSITAYFPDGGKFSGSRD